MSKIGIVIEREYLERVKKKSFIITTILTPLLMLVLMTLPAIIMAFVDSSEAKVLVVDNSGSIAPQLKDYDEVKFELARGITVDSALNRTDVSAVLVIPANIIQSQRGTLKLYSNGPSSISTESSISRQINDIIESTRLKSYNIENLDQILDEVKSNVAISTVRNDKENQEAVSAGFSYAIGIGMSFILYMFLLIYGQMVMTSIIEEKGNRVLEVVVSSVKPMQLMMGKIIGVALVAVTQIILWGILLSLMSAFLLPAIMPADVMTDISSIQAGNYDAISNGSDMELLQGMAMIGNVGNILSLVAMMTIFLIFGFLLYSSFFAAIGSSADNIQDASQLTSVAVFPIIFGIMFALVAAADPMGTVAFWASIFPLTSPMVMVARIPFGIPAWEIALSLVLLIASFIFMVWLAGKIYRVGIFMYGKKPTIKEVIRWTRYK